MKRLKIRLIRFLLKGSGGCMYTDPTEGYFLLYPSMDEATAARKEFDKILKDSPNPGFFVGQAMEIEVSRGLPGFTRPEPVRRDLPMIDRLIDRLVRWRNRRYTVTRERVCSSCGAGVRETSRLEVTR